MGSGLLINGNGRGEALNLFHVRFVHQSQKLPGVSGQALDVATLPFRVDGVKGQRRFSRSRQTRKHDEFVAGQIQIDVLQIVHLGPADFDQSEVCQLLQRKSFFCHIEGILAR